MFLIVFVIGCVNALRQTPIYQGTAQLLIEQDTPNVATLDQMFQSQDAWFNDDFYQTQYRILQSRSLAKRAIDSMKLWDAPRLGNGPRTKDQISLTGFIWCGIDSVIELAKKPFTERRQPVPGRGPAQRHGGRTGAVQRIDEFLGGVGIVPVRNSRIVEIRYDVDRSGVCRGRGQRGRQGVHPAEHGVPLQHLEGSVRLAGRPSRRAAQGGRGQRIGASAYSEKNGAVSVADSASNIVVQRLTDLNSALTKAKTERINKEALYNQLKSAEGSGTLDTFPRSSPTTTSRSSRRTWPICSASRRSSPSATANGTRR